MSRPSFRTLEGTLLACSLCVGLASQAQAQDAEVGVEATTSMPASVEVAAPEPEAIPAAAEATPAAEDTPDPQGASQGSWTDHISLGAFVDAYGALRSDRNITHTASTGAYFHDAYVQADGFALSLAGVDVAVEGEQVGATVSLRFGPSVNRFYAADMGGFGLDNIVQAYLSYSPIEDLKFDLGQFGTLYGAEVAESWNNQNYSRGALYYAMQPFWHTGLRGSYSVTDMIGINAMLVNGVNNAFENNKSPSLGVQLTLAPIDELFLAVGYLTAFNPTQAGEAGWLFDNFFDVVATATFGDFNLVANFDLSLYDDPSVSPDSGNFWGVSLAPGYSITDWLGVAARVEYLSDSEGAIWGFADGSLITLTGTLDVRPVDMLVIRPEFRYEIASDDIFTDGDLKATDAFWTVMLGAVVATM